MLLKFAYQEFLEDRKFNNTTQVNLAYTAEHNLLLASAFAEGVKNKISSLVEVKNTVGGIIVNGTKKPGTNSKTMDLLTASVKLPSGELAVLTKTASIFIIEAVFNNNRLIHRYPREERPGGHRSDFSNCFNYFTYLLQVYI